MPYERRIAGLCMHRLKNKAGSTALEVVSLSHTADPDS